MLIYLFLYLSSEEEGRGGYTVPMEQVKRMKGIEAMHIDDGCVDA